VTIADPIALLESRLVRPPLRWMDIRCPLEHFVIASYTVRPERVTPHVALDRFDLDLVDTPDGPRALVSAVTFVDADFHFASFPIARFVFGQTNYRLYGWSIFARLTPSSGRSGLLRRKRLCIPPASAVPRPMSREGSESGRHPHRLQGGRCRQ
jgi:hypothetical protein